MRRKARVEQSAVSVRSKLFCAIEACEPRRLLSAATTAAGPILSINPSHVTTVPGTLADGATTPPSGVLTPLQIRTAYSMPSINFGGITGDGTGQTIGIVDAYDDPNAASDLQAFDAFYGLPDPNFTKLNQQGQPSPLPPVDPYGPDSQGSWEVEESLDIEWAHVMAPGANIILFEADNDLGNLASLFSTVTAADNTPGVSVISMSFGIPEFAQETQVDSQSFVTPAGHTPITWVAAAGDSGAFAQGVLPATIQPIYPGSSPRVVSVGGTSLTVNPNNTYGSETVWGDGTGSVMDGGGGGGISSYETQPSYQAGVVTQSTTRRAYPDVSLDADPATGVAIYDSYDFGNGTPWLDTSIGGTSLAAPLFSGIVAVADQGRVLAGASTLSGPAQTLPDLYSAPSSFFHDIVSGNNGYPATTGYDLASGLGSPIASLLVQDFAPHIGNQVFDDANGNGIQDDTSGGLANVTVTLKSPGPDGIVGDSDDSIVQTTVTDSTGKYIFSGVPSGSYYINFSLATGFHFSPQFATTNTALDSNVNPATGNTNLFTYLSTSTNDTIDAGEYNSSLSINSVSVVEGNSGTTAMTFTVSLTGVSTASVSVPYTTVDGTATVADNDYIPQSGTLTFAPNQTTATITVLVVGDTKIENNETFLVRLTNPVGFAAGTLTGVGTIINDDFPTVSVSSYTLLRPDTGSVNFPFIFTLSAPAPFEVDVPYTTVDVTAIGTIDYAVTRGTLVFPADTTSETVNVSVFGSLTPTLDKSFQMVASASPSVLTGPGSTGTGTILTNSPPGVRVADSSVTESLTGLTYLPFNVFVGPSQSTTVTVDYATSDGTAVAGIDYGAVSGTLTFIPGQNEKTVYVPVYRELNANLDKTLTLTLTNLVAPTNVTLYQATATGTIHDLEVYSMPISANEKAVYTDYLNNKVTVSMTGPGVGSLLFLGGSSTSTNGYEIDLTGTTSATSLNIKTPKKAQTAFTNINDSGSLGSINGKGVNVQGAIDIAGSLNSILLNYISASTLTVGAGTGSLNIDFNRALDTSITSAIPIRSLTAGAYLNTDGVEDDISTPSFGTLNVKGTFGGTIVATSVAGIRVGGALDDASIRATDSIGSVVAGSITGSTLFAGVAESVTTLPTSADEFVNQASRITSVKVKSGAFSDSLIAGWTLGKMSLGAAQPSAGSSFAVTAAAVPTSAFGAVSGKLLGTDDSELV